MVDHEPRPIDPEELGVETAARKVQIEPLRDKRGRIRWKLPSQTEEGNLQIGISNVQWLFLSAFPEFEQQFPRDEIGMIVTEKRENARDFILQHLGTSRDFVKYIGDTPLNSVSAPYFERSFIVAIRRSFSSWGIEFEDEQKRLVWTKEGNTLEENKHLGIHNLQGIMLSKIPEIRGALVQIDGQIVVSPSQRDQIKTVILEKCGGQTIFESVFGPSSLTRTIAPYFNGSYIHALTASLEAWGIQVFLQDFSNRQRLWAGKTEAECIANMQTIWLETYPEFTQLFPFQKDGFIKAEKRDEARIYILERMGRAVDFKAVFGSYSITQRSVVPYFDGSFITAVRKTFKNWGINFTTRDFIKRNLWKGKEKDEILETMRVIFLEEHPEFREMFLNEDLGRVEPEKAQGAKLFILECIGSVEKFTKMFPRGYVVSGHSYVSAIEEAFAPVGVQFQPGEIQEFAQSNRRNRTDAPQGWMTNNGVANMFGRYFKYVRDITERYRLEHPEWFRAYCTASGHAYEYYAPELISKIKELSEESTGRITISPEEADERLMGYFEEK